MDWLQYHRFFLMIAVVGPFLAPYSPDHQDAVNYVETDNGSELMAAPFPPSANHWFGTDEWGYDILSLLLYGAKYTLFITVFTALLRTIIGGVAGLLVGMRKKEARKSNTFALLGSIPAFLIVYFAMYGIVTNSTLPSWKLVVIQGILMTIVGIPGIYGTISEKTSILRRRLFVTASESLGGGTVHVIKKHILPHITVTFYTLFIKEMILVLGLMGQLGIFDIFLGGTIKRETAPFITISKTHEWAGIIGQWRQYIYDAQWILFIPLCAYIILVLGFYLLSRGIELKQWRQMKKAPYI